MNCILEIVTFLIRLSFVISPVVFFLLLAGGIITAIVGSTKGKKSNLQKRGLYMIFAALGMLVVVPALFFLLLFIEMNTDISLGITGTFLGN